MHFSISMQIQMYNVYVSFYMSVNCLILCRLAVGIAICLGSHFCVYSSVYTSIICVLTFLCERFCRYVLTKLTASAFYASVTMLPPAVSFTSRAPSHTHTRSVNIKLQIILVINVLVH